MFDSGDVLDRMVARERQLSQLQAAQLADAVEVADMTPRAEFAAFEISSALTWTRQAATVQLELAHAIVRRLPLLHAAMAAGDIDLPRARVIVDGVIALDLDLARGIVAAILPQAPTLTTGELRHRLAKLVIAAAPGAAAKRHKARVRGRRVELQPTEDSCATLLGLNLPAHDALAASNRLIALARAIKQTGDPRSLDQLRADTFLNLLLGNACHHHPGHHAGNQQGGNGPTGSSFGDLLGSTNRRHSIGTGDAPTSGRHTGDAATGGRHAGDAATGGRHAGDAASNGGGHCCSCSGSTRRGGVELTADLETLARLSNMPGDLGGYGPVIAEIARQVAQQQRRSPWTFTIRDRATGRVFNGATRRRPTAALARHVRARDRTCRAPGCRRIGIYADIDHTIAYERGGLTVAGNLGLLCRYHHRAKHEGWWLLVQVRPGVFVWRSPLGRRYTVYPAAP